MLLVAQMFPMQHVEIQRNKKIDVADVAQTAL